MLTAQEVLDIYHATRLPSGLTAAQRSGLGDVAALLLKGDVAGANVGWSRFCSAYITRATAGDVRVIERWVLNRIGFRANSRLRAEIQRLEQMLNAVGDDAELANVDLQNVLQKQQQTIQMLSNISKMLHDVAMATIRKIG